MAKRVKFGGVKKSKADHVNPFFSVMSPAEREFAAERKGQAE